MARPATGDQHLLTLDGPDGGVTAVVTELAGSLRRLTVGGAALVQDYTADALPSQGSGIVLVPWPNRVRDARWTLDGETQQLDVTEPKYGNATHGLLRNTGYRVTDRSDSAITLSATVFPQHGWPFLLDTSVRFELQGDGLRVTHGIHNASDRPAPAGIGVHPYLRVGDAPMRSLVAHVSGATVLDADEQKIPVGRHAVAGTPLDATGGLPLADATLDTCYTDLVPAADGLMRHRLVAPDGSATELWAEPVFAFAQLFTSSIYETDDGQVDAVALEPMTCAPDALNSGDGLRWLEPDEQWVVSWGLVRHAAPQLTNEALRP